jgi:hypothetical protein
LSETGDVVACLEKLPEVWLRSCGWSVALSGGGHFSLRFLTRLSPFFRREDEQKSFTTRRKVVFCEGVL